MGPETPNSSRQTSSSPLKFYAPTGQFSVKQTQQFSNPRTTDSPSREGGVGEVQDFEAYRIHLPDATGGTFTLTYNGQTTGALAYNISAVALVAALEALSTVTAGDVTVGVSNLPAETDIQITQYQGEMSITPASLTPAVAVDSAELSKIQGRYEGGVKPLSSGDGPLPPHKLQDASIPRPKNGVNVKDETTGSVSKVPQTHYQATDHLWRRKV